MDAPFQISDLRSFIKGVIRRRKKVFFITFILIFTLVGAIAFVLPPVYLSESTILVEAQQIPQDYVKSTITAYVAERLQVITRQVMTRAKLMKIMNQFNLYPEMRDRNPTEMIITKMRKDIKLETIHGSGKGRGGGKSGGTTIAFTLSYEGKDPSTTQKVTSSLASLYLEEELKTRERLASTTAIFFQEELASLKKQLSVYEIRISKFKEAHIGELPEHNSMNLQRLDRVERELDQLNMRVQSIEERKVYLKGQIASVDPLVPVVIEGEKIVMNPKERLKRLRLRLMALQSTLSEKHPDIKKLKIEIKELESLVGKSDDSVAKVRMLSELKGELAAKQGKLGPKHPDVIKLSKQVRMLSKEVDQLLTEKAITEVAEEKPDSALYINLMTQIAGADIQIKALLKQRRNIEQEIKKYQIKLEKTPVIEKEYSELTRDYNNAKRKYDDLLNKSMEAKIAQGMEETQRGERFTIIDPAQLPEKPYKPNRMLIMLLGFVLALGAGVALCAAQEGLDNTIKTADELSAAMGVPVFSEISLIETNGERRGRRIKKLVLILAAIGVIVMALILVNQFVIPLDILWIKIQRRLEMMWWSF
jgi:uncharacterized protein involved in exopolysaccharide biosynthesis